MTLPIRRIGLGFSVFWLISVSVAHAGGSVQFITIVNPVRISSYNPDPDSSLRAEYAVVQQNGLPATWLVTYDILDNPETVSVLKTFDVSQEIGLFLEVTPSFAKAAGVAYHDSGDWHYANAVLLSGYSVPERTRLIDTVFDKFKSELGSTPLSIGSWWTDSFSLNYIKSKYAVVANLGVSDQFQTDGYQVWGQYWSTPYYPSKNHPAVPATSPENKLNLVTIQWAPRDPDHGYTNSLYSTQDYFTSPNLQIDYFTKLVNLYAQKHRNQFGQVTVGLEGDFPPSTYAGEFSKQLSVVSQLVASGKFSATTMRQFSDWYRNKFPEISPPHLITSDDLLGGPTKTIWYQTPKYRIGLVQEKNSEKVKIVDLRFYSGLLVDPYRDFANGERDLFINIPSRIDTITNPKSGIDVDNINFDEIAEKFYQPPPIELNFHDYSLRVPYALRSRLGNMSSTMAGLIVVFTMILVFILSQKARMGLIVLLVMYLIYFHQKSYLVSQSEMDALGFLATLPKGNVMIYDKDCLRCTWPTPYQPAALANKRGYVSKLSQHPVTTSNLLLAARDSGAGKLVFKKTHIRYLYLAKYGDYIETTHFPAKDLNLTKIYENANAAVWQFNEDFD